MPCFGDTNAVFCEDFEGAFYNIPMTPSQDGQITTSLGHIWSVRKTANSVIIDSTTGFNGSATSIKNVVAVADTSTDLDTGFTLHTNSGDTFWVEWYEKYDTNFRWTYASVNSEHKDFGFTNSNSLPQTGRVLWAPTGIPNNPGTDGLHGSPRIYFFADPEPFPTQEGHRFFTGNQGGFSLTPGTTYHFVLQVTSGFKDQSLPFSSTVGSFKMWANGVLTHDYSNVGTCGNASGGCDWNNVFLSGPQAGVGSPSNIWWYDQIRITTTNLTPGGDVTPPTAPGSLTATTVSSNRIDLSWIASVDDVGVTGYFIEQALSPSGTFAQVGTSVGNNFSATGLAPSTAYMFRVRAKDNANNLSPYSNTATATTQSSGVTPGTPTLIQHIGTDYGTVGAGITTLGPTSTGDSILVMVYVGSLTETIQVSDSFSNTYTLLKSQQQTVAGHTIYFYWAANIVGGGTHSVTIAETTIPAQNSRMRSIIQQWSGLATTAAYDKQASAQQNGASVYGPGTFTTSNANDLLIAFMATSNDRTFSPDGSFTLVDATPAAPGSHIASEWRNVTSVGAYTAQPTINTADNISILFFALPAGPAQTSGAIQIAGGFTISGGVVIH